MKRILWLIGAALQRLGSILQKVSGWKAARKIAATGKPRGRPRKKKAQGTPLPFEPAQAPATEPATQA